MMKTSLNRPRGARPANFFLSRDPLSVSPALLLMRDGETAGLSQPPRGGREKPSRGAHSNRRMRMKKLILLITALAFTLSAFSGVAFAQEKESAKNLYLARIRQGVKVSIELKRDGETRKVPLNYVFRAGDRVKFHFETNFNAYVKVINIGSTGALQLLYPYQGAPERVESSRDYAIPRGDLWLEFDRNPGTERLTFVFSSRPLLAKTQSRGAAPRPNNDSLTPNRPNHSAQSNGDEQQDLADLNARALENGKDFNLVTDSQENHNSAYGVAKTRTVRIPIGVRIDLRHR
jgi:Domain of unknown function (DUF4384)